MPAATVLVLGPPKRRIGNHGFGFRTTKEEDQQLRFLGPPKRRISSYGFGFRTTQEEDQQLRFWF